MKNYYEELKQYLTHKEYKPQLDKLEQIKSKPVEVIKMYNQYGKDIKDYTALQYNNSRVGLHEDKTYTIKSEDKAALINRLEKVGIAVGSYQITDNKMDNSFSIKFIDPKVIDMVNQVLKQSSKIDSVKAPKSVYTDEKVKSGDSMQIDEGNNPLDVIKMDIPLFIRMLEYAREDAKTDMDLHDVTERAINLASDGRVLTMKDYNNMMADIVAERFNPDLYEWEE
jgi:hypothetical protein